MDPSLKISNTTLVDYINEHFGAMEKAVKRMREAIDEDFAVKFVDEFGQVQWQERSILFACKSLMEQLNFTESDLMVKPLDEYKE